MSKHNPNPVGFLGEAIAYIAEYLAPANVFSVAPDAVDSTFFDKPVHRPDLPRPTPLAEVRLLSTLKSLAQYLTVNVDELALDQHLLHVVNPGQVDLVSRLEDFHRRRETVVSARYTSGVDVYLDKWVSLEEMNIALMSLFTEGGDRTALLATLKSVKTENAEIRDDDGMGQKVNVSMGAVSVGTVKIQFPRSGTGRAALYRSAQE
jgi:hypothetical protein